MKYRKTVKEKQNDDQIEYAKIIKETVNESARRWFRRPAYDIKGSGASGTSGNDGERTEEEIS